MFAPTTPAANLQTARARAVDHTPPSPPTRWARLQAPDPVEQMALADAADLSLLRLVACAAAATLLLAVATSML